MIIGFKKRYQKINLILAFVWLALGLLSLDYDEGNRWTDYGYLVISILYFGLYLYQRQYNNLTIEGGMIKMGGPFGKKLNLAEVKGVKKFAGDYILKTDTKEMTINTQELEPDSLAQLDAELGKLNVEG